MNKVPRSRLSLSILLDNEDKPIYRILSTIKSRHNSIIFKAQSLGKSANEIVVIKSLVKERFMNLTALNNELKILSSISHVNIINLIDSYEDETHLNMVIEYCNGGDLYDDISGNGPLPEAEAAH